LRKIKTCGLVAVVRTDSTDKALRISNACIEAGVAGIELTYTVPTASKIIEKLSREYSGSTDFIIGAGSVMDSETARIAILSGTQYVVSPYLDVDMIKMCNSYNTAVIPGTMTVWEIAQAMKAGAEMVKLFPCEILGPGFIEYIHGPLPYAQMMPTGGITLDNVGNWIKAGAAAVGAGVTLTYGADFEDYECVRKTAKEFLDRIGHARSQMLDCHTS